MRGQFTHVEGFGVDSEREDCQRMVGDRFLQ